MDEIGHGLDPDELMDLEEGSELDEDDDDLIDDPLPSPFQFPSSGSAATSAASSPPNDVEFSLPFAFSGKPFSSMRRGRGRPPRREGLDVGDLMRLAGGLSGKPLQRRLPPAAARVKKIKPPGLAKRKKAGFDFDFMAPSPSDDFPLLDTETGALIFTTERPPPQVEELPYFPEQWPGKVCVLCNLGERSQLGQADMLRLLCPEGFIPQRVASENSSMAVTTPEREAGDKSPRGPVTCRRQKSFNKCRHPSLTSEYVDELTIIGYVEEPHVSTLFDSSGYFYIHRNCALWSNGVVKNENSALENVCPAVLQSSSRKCSFCNHFGASLMCKVEGCLKSFHFPCATASGAFQVLHSLTLYCSNHIGQVSIEYTVCYTCKTLGDIANLMYCSACGEHYHGICVGLAQHPGVRAGWQCRKCRLCQVCRMSGDETKLMTCEQCDKIYHSTCQRPIVTSIPKYGWKCRCCRVCGDCGSRTPGAGLSSRWHAHYTVCDSCYQQRNKGFYCPICRRAYRAHAHREMVQCTLCRKFVHGTCDPEADLVAYHQKKELHPEYEYVCGNCKSSTQQAGALLVKRNSTDDLGDCLSSSQDGNFDDNVSDFDTQSDAAIRSMGLGKGKPYSASKIAKKRLGLTAASSFRPKGKTIPGKVNFMKRQRLTDFAARKRGAKTKMRGVFGVPGVGLQRPVADGNEEPGVENRLVLCSAKDKFVLTQDICVMCGALGTDQEGCLIACVQCGQCYHPYCVNVKITKVILEKGWRCLDCTICEGCGQRNDEARLILCDDCDISYHIYCMDPPLDYVPHGNWKCKWCAICQSCGATDPGFNCNWMNSFTECGPCASYVNCPSCSEPYSEGDLIIQCVQCERWLHGHCDNIKTEDDAEKCAEEGYNCLLCRPRDVPPPHLQSPAILYKPPTPTKSPEVKSNNNYYVDGVYLSESGFNLIKSLSLEQHGTRKKRKKLATVQDKEAGIMATIESVVAGGSNSENMLDDSAKLELVDVKDEPQDLYKEGMIWMKEDGAPPDGFTIFTMESGMSVLRRKRQRNLQKLGIGGFLVRMRGRAQENDDIDVLPGQSNPDMLMEGEKPRRKPIRRKPKSKLAESFPPYLQEAFFGKDLLDSTKELDSSSSDEEKNCDVDKSIQLSQDEIKAVAAVSNKHDIKIEKNIKATIPKEEEEEENTEDLKDVLAIPGDLLDTELVNTIMNEGEEDKNNDTSKDTKDELSDILGPNFNLEAMPSINSKDVEDIFKGVLTDDSQESQESVFPIQNSNNFNNNMQQHAITTPPVRPTTLPTVNQSNLNSPLNFPPPPSPYQSEYSNSPQFSPAFSEPPSPWVSVNDIGDEAPAAGAQSTYNQRSSEKMKADEGLGNGATISAVLYANINHPEWKTEFPNWSDRYKQILKKWRQLSSEQKAPYLQQARDNRSALRMKKQQQSQISKESPSVTPPTPPIVAVTKAPPPPLPPPVVASPSPVGVAGGGSSSSANVASQVVVSEDQDKITLQNKSAREAEQERQWKQLQATRQQQAQQQQNIIHEQRVQSIARVQRQISDPTPFPYAQEQQSPDPVTSPRQFLNMGMKSPTTFTHPTRPQTAPIEPPKPIQPIIQHPSDPYAHQPPTPRPQFQVRPQQTPELNRQLRDLLQRQQFKKLDDQIVAGKGQQRVWPPAENNIQEVVEQQQPVTTPVSVGGGAGDTTFRQPLPPSVVRPRIPMPMGQMARAPPPAPVGLRMQLDPRIQGLDPRMRLLLQQQQQRMLQQTVINQQQQQQQPQQQQQQVFAGGNVRFASGLVRPVNVEQYEQLLQRQQAAFQQRNAEVHPRLPVPVLQRPPLPPPTAVRPANTPAESTTNDQEIPDNVTAEIEKLEQETGTIAELQGVNDILGGLGEDDDELLAEMGADFNILEYADPEALPGEKTNILDLELEEEPLKNEKKVKVEMPKAASKPANLQLKKEVTGQPATCISQAQPNAHPPPLAMAQGQAAHPPIPHQTPQQIHQQMVHQVQQAAALGKPMPPGSRLQTPDGVIGIVMPNNTVQLQLPQGYQQRFLVSQLQNQKLQMRLGQNVPRVMSVAQVQQGLHNPQMNMNAAPRLAAPPPPPPPYPGPPPPYPGSATPQQMGLRMGPVHLPLGHIHPMRPQGLPLHPHLQRRPLLLEEQPLLLEDLLEQEKREQEKQNQPQDTVTTSTEQESTIEQDFDRFTDVLNNTNRVTSTTPQTTWQQNRPNPTPPTPQPTEIRVQTFNANLMSPPPLPPENIVTEQDKQKQLVYEQWLSHQNNTLTQQLKYYETEVNKLRKMRKSLNSKQRQLRKTGGQLADADASELQRIATEQAVLQKHLETSRKLSRQHGLLIQEYRNKQLAKQRPGPGQSPLLVQQNNSPLGLPSTSPVPQHSPMMSPSASPLTQHNSPLHSPSPMISHSPVNIMQSPNGMSPRIGESSPGPVPSPVCPPPPAPRMTSPRVVTSPVGYSEMRPGTPQMRFVQRRLPSPMAGMSSPPPPQQQMIKEENILNSARAAQLIQQRNFVRQQSPGLTPQQHQMMVQQQQQLAKQQQQQQQMVQQQQQLAKQQQQQLAQMQQRLSQQNSPASPMPPKSPLVGQQIMSPHSMPPSPMPPRSPMMNFNQPPNSPRTNYHPSSPMMHQQYQPPSSPMMMRKPASSPMTPDRPRSVEDMSHMRQMDGGGGGNSHPNNPIPVDFTYFKLGLRGGSPMWSFGRGAKRMPTPPGPKEEKVAGGGGEAAPSAVKPKKESHLSKVSILKRKSPAKTNLKVGSLVSTDYNEFDDSSCTPPVTPPPGGSRLNLHKGKKIPPEENKEVLMVQQQSPEKTLEDLMDYDDDNNTVISGEVSLSAAAQNDGDDIAVIETFSQSDLGEAMSSPLESDQIADEYLLFPGNMVVDLAADPETHYSDKEEAEEEEYGVVIRSPTTSDDEFIMQNKKKFKTVNDEEEIHTDPEEEIVIIDSSAKSPEISTKEDFEELIDEGKKDKPEMITAKHINEIHKYAANVYSLTQKSEPNRVAITSKLGPKISLITTPVVTQNAATTSKLANIILQSGVRTNVFNVPKLVTTSGSPAITIVSANTSPIASILQPGFTVPVISASAVRQLPNVKVIDKPSSSLSLKHDSCLPKKIFEDDSVSPDSSNCEDDKSKDSSDEKSKIDSPTEEKEVDKKKQRTPSPVIAKTTSPVLISTPELKMTAQVIQESKGIQLTARTETEEGASDDTKSVVISIPSPTPSQEQMLDDIALQALQNRRRDGNGMSGEFESFEDVFDMITNITGEPPTILEDNIKDKASREKETTKPSQLSPLSQPTELTTNMANASQQLRTLLSLHTTTVTTVTNTESVKVTVATTPVTSTVIVPNTKQKSPTSIQLMPEHPKMPETRKTTCSLTEMLQSHPAASVPTTKTSTDTITAASLLGTSMSLRTGFSTSLVQAQPTVVSTTTTAFKPVANTNLLHTQLTKVRQKSEEEEMKEEEVKTEPTTQQQRNEDSQNALLKKLLQNTACASTQTPPPATVSPSITVAAPSLENQLKAAILSPVVKENKTIQRRETSFVSSPVQQQLHIDVKKCMPPSRTPSRDELLSPPTPRSSCSQDSSLQTPPLVKKELPIHEVKKEFVDETSQHSQHSEVSDQSRSDVPMKEELDSLDPMTEKMLLDKEELKKQKRRMYQQKRRQNQLNNKDIGQPKKRPRKSSKVDEDYDTYIDGVLAQLRTLNPMVVSEPVLNRNFNILPIFGSDFAKLTTHDYDTRFGELKGEYGNAYIPGVSDFYNTQPYGDLEQLPEKSPASTQRGFYDQEFPLIKFDNDEDKRFDMFCREDTPDSVISSSSPECVYPDPPHKFLGLKLINEDDDDDEEDVAKMRLSPVVPIVAPIPIRLKPSGPYLKDYTEDKENVGRELSLKSKFNSPQQAPLKDSGNVTVTLTLTSAAAEDIMGVLRDLANILHIPAPTSYQIVERTSTPPSQKLGLYRTRGKDGKEGAPIDIQSILNGAAKFCKHCDVVILSNMIRKKVSELPFLSKDSELLSDGDELFFCSTTCYMQFALMHRSPSIPEDKAAAIIDHLCQKDRTEMKGKRPLLEAQKRNFINVDELYHYKREMEPMDLTDVKSYSLFTKQTEDIKLRRYDENKVWKGTKYKIWTPGCLQPANKHKKLTDKETMELLYRMGITVTPIKLPEDYRKCMFCQGIGDGVADGPARLLNFDVDKWVHLNCGLWSDGVYETVNGALMNLENALQQSLTQMCVHCNKLGATIRCFKTRCSNIYHLTCAVKDGCVFYKNKTTFCTEHVPKNEKDNELTTLAVSRRVYVNRDENRQVAAVMHHSETNNLLRVGSLIFLSVGQLLPHQLQNFHNHNYIYPIGYKIIRFYWSMRQINKRCKYICSIHESFGKPEFRVVIQEGVEDDVEFKDSSPKAVWHRILDQIVSMRREHKTVHVFPQFVSGEDLFGLTEPAVVRVLESLPGIETLTDYKFKYGRNPLLELPLAINPSGSARTEPRSRSQLHWKRPHTQRTGGTSSVRPMFGPPALTNNNLLAEGACPYTKQFVHSKSSQYKKMKQEWRNNVYLARSKIQGLGLYAARDLEKHTMVIEYIGEIIRTELAETREKKYEAKNRGIYMFRLDEERVVDATLCGGLARYINHSCNPNCVAETVEVDRDYRIIIFAKRRIQRGEELAYDYKFDIEDDQHKISCMCGAPNCRKWMN